jgi:WD40 repeat protein
MDNSLLTEARLDHCLFIESSLKNLKYNQFIDLKRHLKTDTCIAFSSDGKYLASSADNTVRIWSVEA